MKPAAAGGVLYDAAYRVIGVGRRNILSSEPSPAPLGGPPRATYKHDKLADAFRRILLLLLYQIPASRRAKDKMFNNLYVEQSVFLR